MKILLLLFLVIQAAGISNTKWAVTRSFTPATKGEPIEKSAVFNDYINEKVIGMQIQIEKDSIFMMEDQHIIDKGKIEALSDHDIKIKMGNNIINIILYEYGASDRELILTLPDGIKLYMSKIE